MGISGSRKATDEELLEWDRIIKSIPEGMSDSQYACQNNIDYKKLTNIRMRLCFKRNSPEERDRLIPLAELYIAIGLPRTKFCAKHDVDEAHLSAAVTHINYTERLNKLLVERQENSLMNVVSEKPRPPFNAVKKQHDPIPQFVQLKNEAAIEIEPEQELIQQKNRIELSISDDIKVSIGGNVDAGKIIKIIELLKEI